MPEASRAAVPLTNLAVTGSTAGSVWPAGLAAPLASSLNWAPGVTIPNSVTTRLSGAGAITIRHQAGSVQVIVDTNGWYR